MEETPGEMGRAGLGPLWFGMGGGAEMSVTGPGRDQLPGGKTRGRVWERGFVEAAAGGGSERPGSLVRVPTVPLNLFAALGKFLNHSEPIHMA